MQLSSAPLDYSFQGYEISTDLWSGGAASGPTVIGLHGFTGSGADFTAISEQFEESLRLVAPDLPGHGSYSASDAEVFYGVGAGAALVRALQDRLGTDSTGLLGYSMGARLALSFAVAHPDRVDGLVLVGGRPGLADSREREERVRLDEKWAELIEGAGVEAFLDKWQAQPLITTQGRIAPHYLEPMQRRRLSYSGEGWARSLRAFGTGIMPPLWSHLASIKCHVALVVGEEDQKFRVIAERMASTMASSEVVVIPGRVGHAAHLEAPELCAREICRIIELGD